MGFPVQLPPNLSQEAQAVWQLVAESLTTGDITMLQSAVQDFIALSPTDKKTLEDVAALLPFPGLPPLLITQIFSNPEATIGIIERLSPQTNSEQLIAQLGTAEQAIVLDALISWLKAEQKISDSTKTDATSAGANPLNLALQSYIATGGGAQLPLNMGSLQFLKNNTISLSGLQIADPALLSQAYQIASQQLLIGLLPSINTMVAAPTQGSEQARTNVIQHQLVDAIRKALQEGAIPLNMQTFLVLWTAISLPTVQGQQAPVQGQTPSQTQATSQISTNAVKAPVVSESALLPAAPIVTSVLASLPSAFVGQTYQVPQVLTNEIGMLSYIYTQMAPYWSGPAAVSLMQAQGGMVTEQAKTESAVRAFAIALGALLNDPAFDQLLTVLIKTTAPSISEEQLKIFISAMKISILTNVLVALYIVMLRKTQGQFRGDELAQLLLGTGLETQGEIDDLEKGIIKSIQAELLNIPPVNRETFVYNLLSAYSGSTDVNALIDPSKQFLNLCDPTILLGRTSTNRG